LERRAAGDPDQSRKQDLNHSRRRSPIYGAIDMADQDRKETERRLNQARQMAAALVTVTERLAELIDELEGKLRTEKEEK
jgi:hypothetical protein